MFKLKVLKRWRRIETGDDDLRLFSRMKKLLLLSALILGTAAASQAGVDIRIGLPLPPLPSIIIGHPAPRVVVPAPRVMLEPPCAPVVVAPPVCAPPVLVAPPPRVVYVPRHDHHRRYVEYHRDCR
jgi:hypothetical protein